MIILSLSFAGATLCKGLNRALGTLLAGLLAFLVEYIAEASGRVFQALFIGAALFLIGMYFLISLLQATNDNFTLINMANFPVENDDN